ncbi:hypothetical protein JKG68_21590 [Microvirga aerilata]|uniref:Uncharacterized protein n=1 Tax=Microvirga aerilata TaxID=670292 RepID=A0A936ZEZ0_9HYPH|nr:hypothetical protein [Microvirga aerilata]MBL0406555.1 hypothetical protein [Microvirga aerilata]
MKSTTIMLPGARVAQLRALAEADGTTISEVIDRLINAEIAAGRLPDRLPGFDVVPTAGRVFLSMQTFTFPAMSPAQARKIADILDEFGTDKEGGKKATFGKGDDEISFKIARKGRGIIIAGDDVQTGRTMKATVTPGMARDLARIIRTEATKAAKHR